MKNQIYKKTFRRDKVELLYTLLECIGDGIDKPTKIMYAVGLSWRPCQRMLDESVEGGYILRTSQKGKKDLRTTDIYQLTEKGRQVFKMLEGVILEIY